MSHPTLATAWPEHADHEIIYSEHGRTDYLLQSVSIDSDGVIQVEEYDNRAVDGKITDTEYWCRTCGKLLHDSIEEAP